MNRPLFFFLTLLSCFYTQVTNAQTHSTDNKFVVIMDAGHGGKDPGTSGNGLIEKEIALDIALKTGKLLEKDPSMKVIYTRTKDVFVPLIERANIANNHDADLFVSIHCNAHSSQAHGTETWVLGLSHQEDNMEVAKRENSVIYLEDNYKVTYEGFNPQDPTTYISLGLSQMAYMDQSILLASLIQKQFKNEFHRVNRGVKQNYFVVLRETYMPSVLVETGFLTNNEEAAYLGSAEGQKETARAIYEAVEAYKEMLNLNAAKVNQPEKGKKKESTQIYNQIKFRVQIAAGSTPLKTKPYNFKDLKGVERKKEGDLYKYYYGSTSDYLKIQEKKRIAQSHGFSNSYIVAFKDGKKLSVSEALKTKVE